MHTTRIKLRDGDRGGDGRRPKEEGHGGLVEDEGADPELELDQSPRFGAIGAHEGLPRGGRGEAGKEGGVGGVSEPRAPDAKALQPQGELEPSSVVAEEGHSGAETTARKIF